MLAQPFDDRACGLGEGPLWHPERQQLFWVDINSQRILSRDASGPLEWQLDEPPSAMGWIDRDTLMVVTASGFWRFDIATGARERLAAMEEHDAITRSNDGRTDPVGGFWVGTMGRSAETGRGAIYRYFRGEVRRLYDKISIPNAICFSPDKTVAYFTDTADGILWKQHIDRAGWPSGRREPLIDFGKVGLNPDGAVCDSEGDLWIAQWGGWRVACHGPDGTFKRAVDVPASQVTCPAFCGENLTEMRITTAADGLPKGASAHQPGAGTTWSVELDVAGQTEHRFVP